MAFHADKWARAFMAVSGANAESAFQCFKTLAQPVKAVRGVFFGHNAAAELEKMLRESASDISAAEPSREVEYAIRFLCLLVEKNYFKFIDILLPVIERKVDEQKGVLSFYLDTASPVDSGFEKELSRLIKDKMGAADVKLKTTIKPELLGGYRLRFGSHTAAGGFFIDASVKGQLDTMKADLEAVI